MNQPVRIGGVMRCCLAHGVWPESPNEGQVLPCRYCSDGLRWRDGAWEAKWIGDKQEVPS